MKYVYRLTFLRPWKQVVGLVWITGLEALCCAAVTMQTTVLFTSKGVHVAPARPAKILMIRLDTVSTCL
jgi:hypothetical protein